jgi:hypothetical protein
MRSPQAGSKSTRRPVEPALHERRYSAELRTRGADGLWTPEPKRSDEKLDDVIRRHPSPAWRADVLRIVALRRGAHTRIELDDDTALLLERE